MIDAKKLIANFARLNPTLKIEITEEPGEIGVKSLATGYVHRRTFDKDADAIQLENEWYQMMLSLMMYGMKRMTFDSRSYSREELQAELRPLWMKANCGGHGDPAPESLVAIEHFSEWFNEKYKV